MQHKILKQNTFVSSLLAAMLFLLIIGQGRAAFLFAQIATSGDMRGQAESNATDQSRGGITSNPMAGMPDATGSRVPPAHTNDQFAGAAQPTGMPTVATQPTGGIGGGTESTMTGQGGVGFSTPPTTGPGGYDGTMPQDRLPQTTRIPQNAADQQPALQNGQQQTGATNQLSNDAQYLKSVRDEKHPAYDFLYLAILKRPVSTKVKEKEIYLHEILAGVHSPDRRQELTKAYWNLSEKMLCCYVRAAQIKRLQHAQSQLSANQAASEEISLALQQVSLQYQALELEFIQEQYRFFALQTRYGTRTNYITYRQTNGSAYGQPLVTATTDSQSDSAPVLPVPADFPLAVPYHTKTEELKKIRTLSQKSLLLGRTIPLQYEAIVARVAAKNYADNQWLTTIKFGQSPVTQIEALAKNETELIKAIAEYNNQITDYVTETFGAGIPENRFLAAILVLPERPNHTSARPTEQGAMLSEN